MIELRPYQQECIEASWKALEGQRATLTVMATGTGKTSVFAELARRWRHERCGRVLVLAHREELIAQAAARIAQQTGMSVDVEMARSRASALALSDVVVATVQTMSQPSRMSKFGPAGFGLIIVDEAHHAISRSYRAVIDYYADAKIYGTTATPDRTDKVGLGNIFGSCAYVYDIRQAIDDGWLCPIVQHVVECDGLDISSARISGGDFSAQYLESELERDEVLHQMASPFAELVGQRQTIVFTAGVSQAKRLAKVISGYGINAVDLNGSTDRSERAHWIGEYQTGRLQCLVNCALFTEGFDAPGTSCVAIARPTKSRQLYAQMVGRGTRLAPGKHDLLVLDFVGNCGKHKLVCAADVLDGRELDSETEAAVKERMQKGMPVHKAIDEAIAEVEELRARLRVKAIYRSKKVSPFDVLNLQPSKYKQHIAATERQLAYLRKRGFKEGDLKGMDKRTASRAIDRIVMRQSKDACSIKQARILSKYGLPIDVSFKEASEMINKIAANKWRLPDDLMQRVA